MTKTILKDPEKLYTALLAIANHTIHRQDDLDFIHTTVNQAFAEEEEKKTKILTISHLNNPYYPDMSVVIYEDYSTELIPGALRTRMGGKERE